MESTVQNRPNMSTQGGGNSALGRDINATVDTAAATLHSATDHISHAASETINQAKQKVGEMYDQVNKSVNEQYTRAVGYTRENPGTTTLIALGVGIGVGMLLVNNVKGSRGRRGRVVEPVMNAISTLAYELFS